MSPNTRLTCENAPTRALSGAGDGSARVRHPLTARELLQVEAQVPADLTTCKMGIRATPEESLGGSRESSQNRFRIAHEADIHAGNGAMR